MPAREEDFELRGPLQAEVMAALWYVYRPKYEQSELLARSIRRRLAQASAESRREALLGLVEPLAQDDLDDLVRYMRKLKKRRRAAGRGGPPEARGARQVSAGGIELRDRSAGGAP